LGVGNSSFYGNGLLMIGKYFRKYRSLATGIGLAGASVGQFVMPPVIEYLLETYGLGGTLLIISAMYFHACISGALFRPIEQYGPEERNKSIYASSTINPFCLFYNKSILSLIHNKSILSLFHNKSILSLIHNKSILSIIYNKFIFSIIYNKSIFSTTTAKPATGWRRLFDFSVLRSYLTLHFSLVSFLCFFGFFNFILFLPAIIAQKGIEGYDKAMLLSICGVGDLIARIGTGIFADLNLIARYKIKAMACLLSGVDIFIFLFADSFPWLGFYSFLFGFLGGSYVCLMSVVIVDFVGLALMSKNLAVILLIQGVGASIGQIFLGWIRDLSGSFNIVIILCSLSMASGGLLLLAYPFVRRRE
ncbi:unnamed protein product, partial [Lymnaea stagnalis]